MPIRILDDDLVKFFDEDEKLAATLFWGDRIEQVKGKNFRLITTEWDAKKGDYKLVTKKVHTKEVPSFREEGVFKVRIVDVGQGDGAVIETPDDRLTVIDGGHEASFRRYLHRAFAHRLVDGPIPLDAIIVSHGDADHYSGLVQLLEKEVSGQPLVTTKRVFHNGLAKASGDDPKVVFGKTEPGPEDRRWVTSLVDDITDVPDKKLNATFVAWKKALKKLKKREPNLEIRRIEVGDDKAFDFLGVQTQVLGPISGKVGKKPALPLLKDPHNKFSVGHTINGHSIVLKLTIGNVRILLGADLNIESEQRLLDYIEKNGISIESEVLKVPHHGSHEFVPDMLRKAAPVVSIVSSGDQSLAGSDHIHPRAGLVGALGKYSREGVERPLVYVTEMVAYFAPLKDAFQRLPKKKERELRNAFDKSSFGIVHVRTDGKRVLVATHSGQDKSKEAYSFTVNDDGTIEF